SKEDLTACVKNIIKKYYDFACEINDKNSSGRAVGTQEEIASQLTDLMKEYDKFISALLSSSGHDDEGNYYETRGALVSLFSGDGASEDFHFNAKLDLTDIGVNDAMDAYIDGINNIREISKDENDDWEPETRATFFGSSYESANAFLNIADKYVSVPKLYALATFDVNKDDASNYASSSAKVNIEMEADDINELIPELFKTYNNTIEHTYIPDSTNLPVVTVKPFINLDAAAAMTKTNYNTFIEMLEQLPSWNSNAYDRDPDNYDVQYRQNVKAYVEEYQSKITKSFLCKPEHGISATVMNSEDVPGGIITVIISADYDFATLFTNIIAPAPSSSLIDAAKELGVTASVTVTDYNGNQTFSLSGIDNIAAIIEDIVENFGNIIQ
ncbi:MAG: hypothetical protein K2H09_05060, partial [Treponemataceae bacterium]|nr:hypothetical protein [Treponemataceae bacterium]